MSIRDHKLKTAQEIVYSIENFFSINAVLTNQDVAELNDRLTNEIIETNNRLRVCDDLMRQGLRSEAIQEAELSPNLLDIVAVLDFAQAENWATYVRSIDLPSAPGLLLDIAAELNDAYSATQSLERLMRAQRVHALARSPLKQRLQILRSIHDKDPRNPAWIEELKSYEKVRIREIEAEFSEADRLKSLSRTESLIRELSSSKWKQPPNSMLIDKIKAKREQFRAERAKACLIDLERKINDAYSAFDFTQALELKDQWDSYAVIANLEADNELFFLTKPAFDWIRTEQEQLALEQEKHSSLSALEVALDEEKTSEVELNRLMDRVCRFDELVPERIQRRFAERKRQIETKARRNNLRTLVGSVAIILVVAAIVGSVIRLQIRNSEIASSNENLKNLIDSGKLNEAESFLEEIELEKPYVADDAKWISLKKELGGALKVESERIESFNSYMDSAKKAIKSPPSWQRFSDAFRAIDEADKLVKSEQEKVQAVNLRGDVQSKKRDFQELADTRFKASVKDIRDKLKSLKTMPDSQIGELLFVAKQLEHPSHVSPETVSGERVDLIVSKIESFQAKVAAMDKETRLLDAIKQSVSKGPNGKEVLDLGQAFDNYINSFESSSRAIDFADVIENNELEIVPKVDQWNDICNLWNRDINETNAGQMLKIAQQIRSMFGDFPDADQVEPTIPLLEAITSRKQASEKIKKIFDTNLFQLNYLVEIKNEKRQDIPSRRFYFVGYPDLNQKNKVKIRPVMDSNDLTSTEEPKSFKKSSLMNLVEPDQEPVYFGPAPQTVFVRNNKQLINGSKPFVTKWCELLHSLYTNKEKIDPILQLGLIQSVVQIAKVGSPEFAAEFFEFEQLSKTDSLLLFAKFLDPDDERAKEMRDEAILVLPKLESPAGIFQRIQDKLKNPKSPVQLKKLKWVGIAIKERDEWKILFRNDTTRYDELELLVHGTSKFSTVGKFEGDSLTIENASLLKEGLPIFTLRKGND